MAESSRRTIPPERVDEARRRHALAELVARDGIELKRIGKEWVGLCPFHSERTPSFRVYLDGHYHCFGCGAHGDAIGWRMVWHGESFGQAVGWLLGEAASSPQPSPPREEREGPAKREGEEGDRRHAACALWHGSRGIAGTKGEDYFRARAITIALPESLRWHDGIGAVVARVQGEDDATIAVHRIFPDPSRPGRAREKKLLGSPKGGAVRLGAASVRVALAEGIETALAVMQGMPGLPAWAAIAANFLPFVRLPDVATQPVLCVDRDRVSWRPGAMLGERPGFYWAQRAANAFRTQGRRPFFATPPYDHADFNDLLRESA